MALKYFAVAALAIGWMTMPARSTAQAASVRCESEPGTLGGMTDGQKADFLQAQDLLGEGWNTEAFAKLQGSLGKLPVKSLAETLMAELTAEAAIYAGNRSYAISLLKPIEGRDGRDCLARTLLARVYAGEGRAAECEGELSALVALHEQSPDSAVGKLNMFLLEQKDLKGGGHLQIWYELKPSGIHNTSVYLEVYDASGTGVLRLELDSDDGDQIYFREIHPELAAKGGRRYSLDAFEPDKKNVNGFQHLTIQFFEGRPSYETVRARMLEVVERSQTRKSQG